MIIIEEKFRLLRDIFRKMGLVETLSSPENLRTSCFLKSYGKPKQGALLLLRSDVFLFSDIMPECNSVDSRGCCMNNLDCTIVPGQKSHCIFARIHTLQYQLYKRVTFFEFCNSLLWCTEGHETVPCTGNPWYHLYLHLGDHDVRAGRLFQNYRAERCIPVCRSGKSP